MAKLHKLTQNPNLATTCCSCFSGLVNTPYLGIISLRIELMSCLAQNKYGPFPPLIAQKALFNLTVFLDQLATNSEPSFGAIRIIYHWFAEYQECLMLSDKAKDKLKAKELYQWVNVLKPFCKTQ